MKRSSLDSSVTTRSTAWTTTTTGGRDLQKALALLLLVLNNLLAVLNRNNRFWYTRIVLCDGNILSLSSSSIVLRIFYFDSLLPLSSAKKHSRWEECVGSRSSCFLDDYVVNCGTINKKFTSWAERQKLLRKIWQSVFVTMMMMKKIYLKNYLFATIPFSFNNTLFSHESPYNKAESNRGLETSPVEVGCSLCQTLRRRGSEKRIVKLSDKVSHHGGEERESFYASKLMIFCCLAGKHKRGCSV